MGVRVSILKLDPIIYPAYKNSLFIYLISQKVDLFIHCSLNLYTLSYPLLLCVSVCVGGGGGLVVSLVKVWESVF